MMDAVLLLTFSLFLCLFAIMYCGFLSIHHHQGRRTVLLSLSVQMGNEHEVDTNMIGLASHIRVGRALSDNKPRLEIFGCNI